MSEENNSLVRQAVLHARWRWAGAPLLLSGVVLLLASLVAVGGSGSGATVLFALFGTGLALASFGANHDTALALAMRARSESARGLPRSLAGELDEELNRDRTGTLSLRPVPVVALMMPFLAFLVQGYVVWRLFG